MKYSGHYEESLVIQAGDDISELTSTRGVLIVSGSFNAPQLKMSGNISVDPNGSFNVPQLQTSGIVFVGSNGKFNAPLLKTTGYIFVYQNGSFNAPKLEKAAEVHVYAKGSFNAPLVGKVIARDHFYTLFAHANGTFSAGCQQKLSRKKALKHWNREDERAVLFTKAILAHQL